jgi:hypothetical protein
MSDSEEIQRQARGDGKQPEEGNDKAHTEAETGTKDGRVPADE